MACLAAVCSSGRRGTTVKRSRSPAMPLSKLQHSWVVGCTRLTLIAWLSSKLDGRSHFLLRCSPKPHKYLWCVSKNQGYSAGNSLAIFIRGGEPWLMRYCWRICFKVLEVLYLAAVLPSSLAFQ